jgi:hypothetical protein
VPIVIPPATNYASPLISLPTLWNSPPTEGDRIVPCEIDWGIMGGPNQCVNVNLYGGAAQTVSQICAITIDNSNCSVSVIFIFPDTAQTYEVKALTPVATFPVFTNQTQFYVYAPGALSTDITRFGILNSLPYPVALAESPQIIPPPLLQSVTAFGINLAADPVTAQVVALGINGTLTGLSVSFAFVTPLPATPILWTLADGTHTLYGGAINSDLVVTESGLEIPFVNGIKFTASAPAAASGSTAIVNVFYTVP